VYGCVTGAIQDPPLYLYFGCPEFNAVGLHRIRGELSTSSRRVGATSVPYSTRTAREIPRTPRPDCRHSKLLLSLSKLTLSV
jgi:hypothetical protein